MKSKIILGHPFAGSLYMFFDQQLSDFPHTEPILHPYYRNLFGQDYNYWQDLTFALFTIFDEIILPPADANIPDYHKYIKNDIYQNKELGIYFSWKDSFTEEIQEQLKKDLEDPFICNVLSNYPPKEKEGILHYVRLYIKLSEKYNCPVLCGGTYQELFTYLVNNSGIIQQDSNSTNSNPISFTQSYLNLSVASFDISSLDTLYDIKTNKEIKLYSKNFLKILNKYGNTNTTESEIVDLLKLSLSKNTFYNKVSSVLNTSSIMLSVAGLIPQIGIPFSILGIGGALLSPKLKYNQYSWYQLFYSINNINKDALIRTI